MSRGPSVRARWSFPPFPAELLGLRRASVRRGRRPDDRSAGEARLDSRGSNRKAVLDVFGARERPPRMIGQEPPAEEHPVACEAGRKAEDRSARRLRAIHEQECGGTQGLLGRAVLEQERLPLNCVRSFFEPADERRQQIRVGRGVRIDDDDGIGWTLLGEESLDRPLQRLTLAPRVGLVADYYPRSCLGRDRSCVVGAVVCNDNDFVLVRGIRLAAECQNAVRDRAFLVMGRDQHDYVCVALPLRLSLSVEERGYSGDEQVQGGERQEYTQDCKEDGDDRHLRLLW